MYCSCVLYCTVAVYFDKNGVGEYFKSFAHYPPHKVVYFLCSHAKDGNTIVCKCKNFILQRVDNLLCFTFIERVKD